MYKQKNLHKGNVLYFSLKVCKKTGSKKVRQCIPHVGKGVKTIEKCVLCNQKMNKTMQWSITSCPIGKRHEYDKVK